MPATLDTKAIAGYTATAQHLGFTDFLLNIIPSSIGDAFVSGNVLQIILFGVLFGLALAQFREAARPLVNMLDLFLRGMFGIVRFVMRLAPIGAFGGMAYTIGQYGLRSLKPLAQFTAEVWIVSIVFVVVVLGGIARAAGFSLFKLLRYFREEILITLGTSSSEAVMAPLMLKLEQLGCERSIVGMVMPAGYTFNAGGTAIYLAMGAIFIAQATNTHLSLADEIGGPAGADAHLEGIGRGRRSGLCHPGCDAYRPCTRSRPRAWSCCLGWNSSPMLRAPSSTSSATGLPPSWSPSGNVPSTIGVPHSSSIVAA